MLYLMLIMYSLKKAVFFVFFSSIFLCSVQGFGQDSISINVEEAVERAIEHNFSIDIQTLELRRLEIAKNNRWNVLIPLVNTSLSLGFIDRNSNAGEDRTTVVGFEPSGGGLQPVTQSFTPTTQTLTNSNTISLPLTFQLVPAMQLPLRSYQSGEIQLQKLIQETSNAVRKSYYQILILDSQILLTEEQKNVSRLRLNDTKSLFDSGLVDENVFLQTELASLGTEISLNALHNQRQSAVRNLSLLLGYEPSTELNFVDELPTIDNALIDEILEKASVENNYDFKSQLIYLDILRSNSLLSLSSLLPSLNISFSYIFGLDGDVSDTSIVDSNNWGYQNGTISIGISQSITNILPFSPAFVAFRQSRLEIEKQRKSLESTKNILDSQLTSLHENLRQLKSGLELAERRENVAEKSYRLAQDAYEEGLISFTEFDDAEVELLNANTSVLQARNDIIELVLDIALLLGSRTESQ